MGRIEDISSQIQKIKELKSIKRNGYIDELDALSNRLNDKIFRLVVVGEFSSGKSTFINAIIGRDILKHAATETTATVTYIYNVSEDDKKINTCEIEYNNGENLKLFDLTDIKNYTTVNSDINVAEAIKSVSIYVNFLNINYPIVVADTPGLNGIADKHREITIDEIKKAHACIYLLSGNGVKSTDSDFIKILLNYQSEFVFVQNFIDLLRVSEGETVQSKLSKDIENLHICFGNEISKIKYHIFGVSAVKALASRDLNKTKVFEEDVEIISDRDKLFAESNFIEFENYLYELISSGEYLSVIEQSVSHALIQIIERIKKNLEEECEINEQLKKEDDKAVNIEKAKKIISRIESQKKDQKKRLENFMISRDSENRRSLYEYVKRCLEELYSFIESDLDKKAKSYEEFVTFSSRYDAEPYVFYGKYISNYINGKLMPDIDKRIQNNLNHLCDEAMLRVSNFVITVPKTKKYINIVVNNTVEYFIERDKSIFEKNRKEVHLKKIRIKEMKSSLREKNVEKEDVEQEIADEKNKIDLDKQQHEIDTQRLGNAPGVKQKKVEKKRTVQRTGLLHKARDWVFGEKTETYWVEEPDYTEYNEWKKSRDELENKNLILQNRHNNRMSYLESKKGKIQDDIERISNMIERLQEDIIEIEKREEIEKAIYEKSLKANKQEYFDNEKKKLKKYFFQVLLNSDGSEAIVNKINQHIDNTDSKYLPKIQSKVIKYYSDSVTYRLESLNEMISCNVKELEQKYEFSKKELNMLDEVLRCLKRG